MDQGTVEFTIRPPTSDWSSDGNRYDLARLSKAGVDIAASKTEANRLQITFNGPRGEFFFDQPMPSNSEKGVMVAITWTPTEVILYLNGKAAETRT